MRNGISGSSVPLDLRYAGDINAATLKFNFSPLLAYAVAEVETIEGEIAGEWNALTVISGDNGHGLCQPTPAAWWSPEMNTAWASCDWKNAYQNTAFALEFFLIPAENFWVSNFGLSGIPLIRCIAAEYNAGRPAAISGHARGDVGLYTTHEEGVSYSDHVAANYNHLLALVTNG